MGLSGSSAVVFGGCGNFGEATVRGLIDHGVTVVIADVNAEKGAALEAELGLPAFDQRCLVLELHGSHGADHSINVANEASPPLSSLIRRSRYCRSGRSANW